MSLWVEADSLWGAMGMCGAMWNCHHGLVHLDAMRDVEVLFLIFVWTKLKRLLSGESANV